tara:strand:- start:38352 stop:39002 length:651 start_codon:yes stop_codon:yes gene_type:complete
MKKAIILGSSKGIGKSIAKSLNDLKLNLVLPSSKELDTSNLLSVKKFINKNNYSDILVLNTGGPPAINFFDITEDKWLQYHNQLFLSFVLMLQNIKIKNNGYVFLISSHTIKNPENKLTLSNSYRLGFSSILKTYSKLMSYKKISCVNIAPGPIKTLRLKNLVKTKMNDFEKTLPMKYAANPDEIGNFIKLLIENKIKYLNGVTINFDGGISDHIF